MILRVLSLKLMRGAVSQISLGVVFIVFTLDHCYSQLPCVCSLILCSNGEWFGGRGRVGTDLPAYKRILSDFVSDKINKLILTLKGDASNN
jgi:hypothetical protein